MERLGAPMLLLFILLPMETGGEYGAHDLLPQLVHLGLGENITVDCPHRPQIPVKWCFISPEASDFLDSRSMSYVSSSINVIGSDECPPVNKYTITEDLVFPVCDGLLFYCSYGPSCFMNLAYSLDTMQTRPYFFHIQNITEPTDACSSTTATTSSTTLFVAHPITWLVVVSLLFSLP